MELADLLAAKGRDVHTVPSEGLTGHADDAVLAAAAREGRLLITQDLDLSDLRRFAPGTHPGIVLIRIRDPSCGRLLERLRRALDATPIEPWSGCFVVISERKLRVRRG